MNYTLSKKNPRNIMIKRLLSIINGSVDIANIAKNARIINNFSPILFKWCTTTSIYVLSEKNVL